MGNSKLFSVDGIVFQRDENNCLIMEFKVDSIAHSFRIQKENAVKMAEVLGELYLKAN